MSQHDSRRILAMAAVLPLAAIGFAAGPTFRPDVVVKGSSLAGWHTLGQANWKLDNGVLTGSAKPGSDGGWLVLDKSFQDVGFFASFRCTAGCKTGILLRAEKTPEEKGIPMGYLLEKIRNANCYGYKARRRRL